MVPIFSPPNIAKMEAKHDVKGLIKALSYQDKEDIKLHLPNRGAVRNSLVRWGAMDALVRIGTPSVEPLIAALEGDKDAPWTVHANLARCAAADALGQIGDARAVKPLIATFDESRRHYDPKTHGEFGALRVMNDFIRGLKTTDEYLPTIAGRALVQIGAPAMKELLAAFRKNEPTDEMLEALVGFGPTIVEPIIAMLEDTRVRSKQAVIGLLVRLGDVRAIQPLILYGDLYAADALVRFGAPAVKPLIAALRHDEPGVRRYAAYALGELGDARAIKPLSTALMDSDEYVRRAAFEAHRKIIAAHTV